jgi:hypothetical protein
MNVKQARFIAVILVLALRLAACGGNPNGPSDQGVTLQGTVVGSTFSSASLRSTPNAVVTVYVLDHPEMTATVGADGTFTMRGLPEGGFTLVFLSDGTEIGRLAFSEVMPNQAITITIAISGGAVALVEERRNGIGHGDLEIEGRVDSIIVVNPAGDSKFMIDGHTVIARPGETAIREGNRARTVTDVVPGRQVHVKGVWLPAPAGLASTQEVLAWEIKLQGDVTTEPSPAPGRTCMISGGTAGQGIELEGRVQSGAMGAFMMTVNGNRASGPVSVTGGTLRCVGNGGGQSCASRFTGGARIHVSGTLTA